VCIKFVNFGSENDILLRQFDNDICSDVVTLLIVLSLCYTTVSNNFAIKGL